MEAIFDFGEVSSFSVRQSGRDRRRTGAAIGGCPVFMLRYFEVGLRDGVVVLKPLQTYSTSLEEVRAKVKKLDLDPECVRDAIKWARSR